MALWTLENKLKWHLWEDNDDRLLRNTLKNISNNIMSVITTIKDKICLKPTDVVKENVYKPGNGIDINKYTISV